MARHREQNRESEESIDRESLHGSGEHLLPKWAATDECDKNKAKFANKKNKHVSEKYTAED